MLGIRKGYRILRTAGVTCEAFHLVRSPINSIATIWRLAAGWKSPYYYNIPRRHSGVSQHASSICQP
jgi:hypothetical protein